MLALGWHYATIPAAAQAVAHTARRSLPTTPAHQMRVFAFIAISGLFGGLVFTGATIALPKLLAERLPDAGLPLVGVAAALVFGAAAFAQLPIGRLLDRPGAGRFCSPSRPARRPFSWPWRSLLAVAPSPSPCR